ncbi:hypothetical protein CSE16_08465 [Solibacillus sp. R5-41]|uniref:GNAT family N-acetyltransferase n=1 Tax=Solibacillus sp. R5-41 TaxID=2048654 RepID=UPI000C12968F|nr:GNAT family N-acetyltransferase [Solibacillus sp. R5-41]ATP40080.1 hypothetical protein CSE16_08465 [Solibacillus sp. R5-41]
MALAIKPTIKEEVEELLLIQQEAFANDLNKYQDFETSPVNESSERLLYKVENFLHYTIWYDEQIIGGIDIREGKEAKYRLNRIFLANTYQNKGLGTHIMQRIEAEFPNAVEWSLDTPHLNNRNHHFYEKLGFKKVGEHKISDKLILFDYKKIMDK